MDKLTQKIEQWAIDKGLDTADPKSQMLKVIEETGEIAGALAKNDLDNLREEIGDAVVTLTILALQLDMDLHECTNVAYQKIANRKGKMINGVFVKESDLK